MLLTDVERRYDLTQRECLTVVRAALLLRAHLENTRLTIRADDESFKSILNLSTVPGNAQVGA